MPAFVLYHIQTRLMRGAELVGHSILVFVCVCAPVNYKKKIESRRSHEFCTSLSCSGI